MRLTIRQLRRLIREFGVDDSLRNDAGFFMAGGVSSGRRDREGSMMDPPPGLGNDAEEQEDENDKRTQDNAEKKSQFAVRVADRRGGTYGSARIKR